MQSYVPHKTGSMITKYEQYWTNPFAFELAECYPSWKVTPFEFVKSGGTGEQCRHNRHGPPHFADP